MAKNTVKATTVAKEEKVMTKAKTVAKATTKATKEVVNNAEKEVVKFLKPTEFIGAFTEAGIKCGNPECKDIYRLMGGKKGSSMQVRSAHYRIGTTDADYELVKGCKIDGVTVIEGGNSSDKTRPHMVEVDTNEALKEVLKLYAKNPFNQVVTE